ncbi:hypothetical protein [Nocardia farcinica]|uniref:hypothetical protein n=1 Tax=Nocardia farcinica TaxID=37329 RepID=UPI0024577269|nr:hypothetical protein [Nocardia farcinica]
MPDQTPAQRVTDLEIERDMWRERAERGQLHRDHLVDQLIVASARIAELEQQQSVIYAREELDALPVGSVVLDAYGDVWARGSEDCTWYAASTDRQGYSSYFVFTPDMPMTVLHTPTQEAQQQRRVIETPAELDALPVGSIVREIGVDAGRSLAWRKCAQSGEREPFCWEEFGTSLRSQSSEISLPVIVLWTPEQEGQADA